MRTWKVPTTSYWLRLVAPFLTGLGLGDSPLVILYLCSLAHSFVINIFSFCFLSSFSVFFLTLPYDFLHEVVFLNIHLYYLSKKKKDMRSYVCPLDDTVFELALLNRVILYFILFLNVNLGL